MKEKYLVRIIKSELFYFKNVEYGEIRYMNYSSVEKDARIEKNDIVGIYGQNGSGKTALVEALDIIRCILSGREIPYEPYQGLLDADSSRIRLSFFIEREDEKYKADYEAALVPDQNEKKINLLAEKLWYWRRGATWKAVRDLEFQNPYYDSDSILKNASAEIYSTHRKELKNIKGIQGVQNLAVYCAQKRISIFFNDLMVNQMFQAENGRNVEQEVLASVLSGLHDFGHFYFQVVKVNQLADVNRSVILPMNIHAESNNYIMQGCLPLVMDGKGEVSEHLYKQLKEAIKALNIALKAIIPNLQIELRKISEELDKDGNNQLLVEVYSVRKNKQFLSKYESEGIKRIISLLNYLISVYNDPKVCLVVDELDSGIFEYLLGEILGILNDEAKGQMIFTSHNLRAFEKLNIKSIICSTANAQNRYIRLTGKEKNHNPRDFYIRTVTIGGQKEELYDEADLQSIGYAFRKAWGPENNIKINFSDRFRKKLNGVE